jgi:hypothetical protein
MAAGIRAVSIIATAGEVARVAGLGARRLAPSPAFVEFQLVGATTSRWNRVMAMSASHGSVAASGFKNLRSAPATERSHHHPVSSNALSLLEARRFLPGFILSVEEQASNSRGGVNDEQNEE